MDSCLYCVHIACTASASPQWAILLSVPLFEVDTCSGVSTVEMCINQNLLSMWWLQYYQVIHMDLKSKNILLNREQTVAKITDVGLSRGMQSSMPASSVGTLEYSAPEVLLGRYCTEKARLLPMPDGVESYDTQSETR